MSIYVYKSNIDSDRFKNVPLLIFYRWSKYLRSMEKQSERKQYKFGYTFHLLFLFTDSNKVG